MRRTLIGLVAGVALIAAACGGDDSDGDNGDAETAETTETTAGSDNGDDAAAPPPGGEPGAFADTPFCNEFNTLEAGEDEAELVETLRALDPPEELQADMTTLADTLEELSALDLDNNPEALEENQDTFAAFQQAGLNIQTACTEGPPPGAAPPDDGSGDVPEDG